MSHTAYQDRKFRNLALRKALTQWPGYDQCKALAHAAVEMATVPERDTGGLTQQRYPEKSFSPGIFYDDFQRRRCSAWLKMELAPGGLVFYFSSCFEFCQTGMFDKFIQRL